MAFIYNLTDSWNDAATTWNGIKLAVTNTSSDASSKLLNLTVSGATTASFVVDKSGNLELNGSVNKVTITAPATAATFTLANNSTFATVGGYATTFTFSGATSLTFPTSGTVTALGNTTTGSGSIVLSDSPTLVSPILGTPTSGNLSNCTNFPASGLTGLGAGVGTWLATPSSANLRSAVTDETGSGSLVFATSPTLVTPNLGTPSAATLTNATGLPISTGVSGLGSGVATFLGTPSSANLAAAVTDETGSGSLVFATDPTFPNDVTVGVSSSAQGELILANTTANTVKLRSSNSTAANYTLTFPAAAPVNGYYLQTDSLGQLSWAAGGGGGGGSPGGSNGQVQYNNAGAFGGMPGFTFDGTAAVSLGVASTTSGSLKLYNSASANAITIASGNNSAAWTMTLPTTAGTNGYFLQTDGSGNTTWAAAASGTINTGTVGQITYYSGTNALSGATTGTGVLTALGVNVGSAGAVVVNGGALGTPSSGTLTNATGLPISTGVSGLGTNVATALATNVGSAGAVVVNGGALGTPSSGTLTNATGLPISTGVSGLGTNVATALAVNVGTAGAVVVNGGALGTPSSGTLTNATGLPISTGVSGLGSNVATFLATPSSANLALAITDETGSGALVFGTSPTLSNPTITNYVETYYNIGTVTSTVTLDLANGTFQNLTLTSATALTVTMPTATAGKSFILMVRQPASGTATTVTFTSVKWPAGTAPTVTATLSRADFFAFFSDGTNWYGSSAQNYTP
jgi:hypothetical protein